MFETVNLDIFVSIQGKSMERLLEMFKNGDEFGDSVAAELVDMLRRLDLDEEDIFINHDVTVVRD